MALIHSNNAQMVSLDRDILDSIHDMRCWGMSRATGTSTDCTCKPEYGTVMAPADHNWGCATPAEVGCDYALGKEGKVYPITQSTSSVTVVPQLSFR